jgi:hypothetical protein
MAFLGGTVAHRKVDLIPLLNDYCLQSDQAESRSLLTRVCWESAAKYA